MNGWKRRWAWTPVRLQHTNRRVWWCWVECQRVVVGEANGAFGSGPRIITHYREIL